MQVLGVRGSTAAPGAEFVRYGGHTACLAAWCGDDTAPALLLDAGTGLRRLPSLLGPGQAFRGTVVLSHLHWDHVQGFPFCPAVDHPDAVVRVVLPEQDGRSGFALLAQSMSPPAFPIDPAGLQGRWTFDAVEPGDVDGAGPKVRAFEVAHKGGRTYGYRVDADGRSLAFVPDHAPGAGVAADALDAMAGVDLLIHDAQFLRDEARIADAYGHATVEDALRLAQRVGARRLLLFHHAPGRTDDALDALAAAVDDGGGTITVAAEDLVVTL